MDTDIEIYEYNIACAKDEVSLQKIELKWHRERYETTHSDARWAGVVEDMKDVLTEYSNSFDDAFAKYLDLVSKRENLIYERKQIKERV